MKLMIREAGYFLLLSLAALCLLPLAMDRLLLSSAAFTINRIEKLFIIQLGLILFFIILVALYLVRLVLTMVVRKILGGGAGGGVKP